MCVCVCVSVMHLLFYVVVWFAMLCFVRLGSGMYAGVYVMCVVYVMSVVNVMYVMYVM